LNNNCFVYKKLFVETLVMIRKYHLKAKIDQLLKLKLQICLISVVLFRPNLFFIRTKTTTNVIIEGLKSSILKRRDYIYELATNPCSA